MYHVFLSCAVCQAGIGKTRLAVGPKVTLTFQWPTNAHTNLMEEAVDSQQAPNRYCWPKQHFAALAGPQQRQAAQVSSATAVPGCHHCCRNQLQSKSDTTSSNTIKEFIFNTCTSLQPTQ
jgi:hypothetical protein